MFVCLEINFACGDKGAALPQQRANVSALDCSFNDRRMSSLKKQEKCWKKTPRKRKKKKSNPQPAKHAISASERLRETRQREIYLSDFLLDQPNESARLIELVRKAAGSL
jgi:hypothetical protein